MTERSKGADEILLALADGIEVKYRSYSASYIIMYPDFPHWISHVDAAGLKGPRTGEDLGMDTQGLVVFDVEWSSEYGSSSFVKLSHAGRRIAESLQAVRDATPVKLTAAPVGILREMANGVLLLRFDRNSSSYQIGDRSLQSRAVHALIVNRLIAMTPDEHGADWAGSYRRSRFHITDAGREWLAANVKPKAAKLVAATQETT